MRRDRRPAILHVVHSLSGGGTERTLVALLRSLNPGNGRHMVVTLRAAGPAAAGLPDDVAIRPFAISGRSRTAGVTLARVSHRWHPNLIHARNTGCWPDAIQGALLSPRVRLVLGFHGLETDAPLSRRQRRWAQIGLRTGARFTVVSQALRERLVAEGGIPPPRITVLPNGVDRRRFHPAGHRDVRDQVRRAAGLDPGAFLVGTVGALTPVKRCADLIQAAAGLTRWLPDLRLLIVGDGPLRPQLTQQARLTGLEERIRFVGFREDVPDLLRCLDVYVCASASEGLSNALLEALATGLPVITTTTGDPAGIVRDHLEGYRVGCGDPTAIVQAIRRLADEPDRRRKFSSAARARVGAYDFDRTVEAYESFYTKQAAVLGMRNRLVGCS